MLGFIMADGRVELDSTSGFTMLLPEAEHFQKLELTTNLKEDIEAVEKN